MGADKARVSYDDKQQYRSVVTQQGRVALDADWNEAWQISGEALREDALDFVGPAGTPDDGYRIAFTPALPNFDFHIGPGTMYVGGVRVELAGDDVTYFTQPDLLNPPAPTLATPPPNEFIYLHLLEQEISAVEDGDLRDVALGGPDTAQRSRILQRVKRLSVKDGTCDGALNTALGTLLHGLVFDPATMRLNPSSRLQVGFVATGGPTNPCEPVATGGYLGADNQLIRVQISGDGNILWGFDNASFLYRVSVAPDNLTLKLESRPVDAFHNPKLGQAVDVLTATARLSNGEYVAYACDLESPPGGTFDLVTTLASAYNPDDRTVRLNAPLPAAFGDAKQTPRVFLRIWEQELAFTEGQPISLGNTGVQITVSGTDHHVGDYWTFALRPKTPTEVYPERYQQLPQPPDGPRQWLCPLAVIGWTPANPSSGLAATGALVADCRNPFDNLVALTRKKLGGCCTVTVRPDQLTGATSLQSIIDQLKGSEQATVCLLPGKYFLTSPLRIGPEQINLTIEACHGGVVLQASPNLGTAFIDGLISIDRATNITLRGLGLQMPQLGFFAAGGRLGNLDGAALSNLAGRQFADFNTSIGVRAASCTSLTVEDCEFRCATSQTASVFAAGLFGVGVCEGLRIERNRFIGGSAILGANSDSLFLLGYVHSATTQLQPGTPGGDVLVSSLDDAIFRSNSFESLRMAVWLLSDCGSIRFEKNAVTSSLNGLWVMPRTNPAGTGLSGGADPAALAPFAAAFSTETFQIGAAIARGYSLPAGFDPTLLTHVNQSVGPGATAVAGARGAADPAATGATARPGAAPAPPAALGVARSLIELNSFHSSLLALEAAAVDTVRPLPLSLHVTHNDITASAGPLLLVGNPQDLVSALLLTGNQITTQGATSLPAVGITAVTSCTVTGNVIRNEDPNLKLPSLVLAPVTPTAGPYAAVTGNVFRGPAVLPKRLSSAPLPDVPWEFFNTFIGA